MIHPTNRSMPTLRSKRISMYIFSYIFMREETIGMRGKQTDSRPDFTKDRAISTASFMKSVRTQGTAIPPSRSSLSISSLDAPNCMTEIPMGNHKFLDQRKILSTWTTQIFLFQTVIRTNQSNSTLGGREVIKHCQELQDEGKYFTSIRIAKSPMQQLLLSGERSTLPKRQLCESLTHQAVDQNRHQPAHHKALALNCILCYEPEALNMTVICTKKFCCLRHRRA